MDRVKEMTTYVCDELCRHPREAADQEELDDICAQCPVSEYRCRLLNHTKGLKEPENTAIWKENFIQRFIKVV